MNDLLQFGYKHCENREKLPWEQNIGCWGVKLFLLKNVTITTTTVNITTVIICFSWVLSHLIFKFFHNLTFFFSHNLSFLCFVTIWVLSKLDFFSHNLSFSVLSQFEFFSSSQFEFFSFATFFDIFDNLSFGFFFFLQFEILSFCQILNFGVLSKLDLLSFWFWSQFEFCHKLSF